MSEVVQYILDLKSNQFDSALTTATAKTTTLNSAMTGLASTAGLVFSAFAAYDFISGSIDAFNESDQALAQLNATLKSTQGELGLTSEALQGQAKAMQQLTVFDDDAVISMQSVLATFTQIKGEVFTNAVPAILDLATKMKQDLNSSAVQVGKALNDPIKGISALSRVGVSFTEGQKKVIESLVETGRVAEAQKMILAELNKEFGGSAEAAAAAGTGPFKQLQNQVGDLREEIGGMALEIGKELLPTIKSWVQIGGDLIGSVKELGGWLKSSTLSIVELVSSGQRSIAIMKEMGDATSTLLGPLALLTPSVYKVVDAYKELMGLQKEIQNMPKFEDLQKDNQKKSLQEDFQRLKMKGLSDELAFKKTIANEETALIQLNTTLQEKFNNAKDVGEKNIIVEQLKQAQKERENLYDLEYKGVQGLLATPAKTNSATTPAMIKSPKLAKDNTKTQAVGQKSITINVSINDVAKGFTIVTNNIKEGTAKIKEHLTSALVSSINDFQNLALD